LKWPESCSLESEHRIADTLHHPSDNPISTFVDDHPQHRTRFVISQRSDLRRNDLGAVNDDALSQSLQRRGRRKAVQRDLILLLELEFGVRDAIEKLAVVGQHQQTAGLAVEPADGNDPLRHVDQIEHGTSTTLIRCCGDVPGGLIENQISASLPTHQPAVHADLLMLRIDAHTKLANDGAVHADPSIDDHSLCFSPRRDSVRRDHPLKAFQAMPP
jgi:hypothetical protein